MRRTGQFRQSFSDGKRRGKRFQIKKSRCKRSSGLSRIEHSELDIAIAKACNENDVTCSSTLVERTTSDKLNAIKSTIHTVVFCEQCGKTFDYPSDGYHTVRSDKSFYVCDIFCARWFANDSGKGCIIHEPGGYTQKYERLTLKRSCVAYAAGKNRAKELPRCSV